MCCNGDTSYPPQPSTHLPAPYRSASTPSSSSLTLFVHLSGPLNNLMCSLQQPFIHWTFSFPSLFCISSPSVQLYSYLPVIPPQYKSHCCSSVCDQNVCCRVPGRSPSGAGEGQDKGVTAGPSSALDSSSSESVDGVDLPHKSTMSHPMLPQVMYTVLHKVVVNIFM